MSDPEKKEEIPQNSFIRERIVYRQAETRWGQKLLLAAACGLVFGAVALGVVFGITAIREKAAANARPVEVVIVEKDTTEAATEMTQESKEEPVPETTEAEEASTENPEDSFNWNRLEKLLAELTQDAIEERINDPQTLATMYSSLMKSGAVAAEPVVSVHALSRDSDIFGQVIETENVIPGILWHRGETEDLYVLSSTEYLTEAEGISVEFSNGAHADAVIGGTDAMLGIAVLRIPAEAVPENVSIAPAELGNSYSLNNGVLLYAVGGVYDSVRDIRPTLLIRQEAYDGSADGYFTQLVIDAGSTGDDGGFLISVDGKLVGVVLPEDENHEKRVLGISDIKGVIELLANSQSIPYLGIIGETVTEGMKTAYGMPAGIYIREVKENAPVYEAGIKPGDILVSIGDNKVTTIRNMRVLVENLSVEDAVIITVYRSNGEGYQELQFQLIPGVR